MPFRKEMDAIRVSSLAIEFIFNGMRMVGSHHAEGQVNPNVNESQNGFRF
jgi:hypothetical protein